MFPAPVSAKNIVKPTASTNWSKPIRRSPQVPISIMFVSFVKTDKIKLGNKIKINPIICKEDFFSLNIKTPNRCIITNERPVKWKATVRGSLLSDSHIKVI